MTPMPEVSQPEAPRHALSMTVLMTPQYANFTGNVHGGQILKMLDEVAYACASKYARQYVVTLSVDRVVFREPIHVGELVTFDAGINYVGRTSMEVGIRVTTENVATQSIRHTNTCYFTMVALDADRRPIAVPPFEPVSQVEKRRWNDAIRRRQVTQEVEQALESGQSTTP